jgi:protein phosphatase 2C family protein 2/3|tara:strand:- start:372 stop:866 length:495 start_codon:yes stop_codon:yes gene_type:complete
MKLDEFKSGNYTEALRKAFLNVDALVGKEDYATDTGTTACVVFISDTHIYCSNAGDSRGVLSRGTKGVVPLSDDHKPDNAGELNRIEKASHHVEDSRVDGNLALSRAFGDFQYKDQPGLPVEKQAVTCSPDISETKRTKDDKFIILACDGIWDCLSNEEACALM